MSQRVELRPAFEWTCPECWRDHFERAIRHECSPEELAELRDEHGIQPWFEGEWLKAPESVACEHCQMSFEVLGFHSDEEDPE